MDEVKHDTVVHIVAGGLGRYAPGCPRCEQCDTHRPPEGPNEDVAQCPRCYAPIATMRPVNESYGLHRDDCRLPEQHAGYCLPGGRGHPPRDVIRGYWRGMDEDIAAARERHRSG